MDGLCLLILTVFATEYVIGSITASVELGSGLDARMASWGRMPLIKLVPQMIIY